jgi:hypothetical protein
MKTKLIRTDLMTIDELKAFQKRENKKRKTTYKKFPEQLWLLKKEVELLEANPQCKTLQEFYKQQAA